MGKVVSTLFRNIQELGQNDPSQQRPNGAALTGALSPSAAAAASVRNENYFMASYDFVATNSDELSMRKGETLEVLLDKEERARNLWWLAKNLESGNAGQVPHNYLTPYTGQPILLEGWFDCNRMDANRRLLRAGLQPGTFIVRPCANPNAKLALSVRTLDRARENNYLVKHYQIKNTPDESMYFINRTKPFPTVLKLIEEYKKGGLCSPLSQPCPSEPPVVQFKDIEVSRETINMLKKLGAGSFGDVYMAKWNGILDVAVKTLKSGTAMTPETFLEEAKLMHKLSHPKIVNILGVCTLLSDPGDKILIITEYMENGSLLDYLRSIRTQGSRLEMSVLLDIAYQIADGMAYLEDRRFVHRDLRAANVLVGKDHFVKVADFGLARVMHEEGENQADSVGKFPVKWTAPEAMFENRFTTKSDVWSFGVLLYEILSHGSHVYAGMSNRDVMQYVREPKNRLPVPQMPEMSTKEREIVTNIHQQYMMMCWNPMPDYRPTFFTLKNEFEDIDKALEKQYSAE